MSRCNYSNSTVNNNLQTRESCPSCKNVFIGGFDSQNMRRCPSCKNKFVSAAAERGGNNVYYKDGCPAIMSDGRFITYYNSTNELTEKMRKVNGIKSPNEFRIFMQNNGQLFMDAERAYIERENTCNPTTACSEGWYNLWTKYGGNWAALDAGMPNNTARTIPRN